MHINDRISSVAIWTFPSFALANILLDALMTEGFCALGTFLRLENNVAAKEALEVLYYNLV